MWERVEFLHAELQLGEILNHPHPIQKTASPARNGAIRKYPQPHTNMFAHLQRYERFPRICQQIDLQTSDFTLLLQTLSLIICSDVVYDMLHINKHDQTCHQGMIFISALYIFPPAAWPQYPHPAELSQRAQVPVLNNRSATLLSSADAIEWNHHPK